MACHLNYLRKLIAKTLGLTQLLLFTPPLHPPTNSTSIKNKGSRGLIFCIKVYREKNDQFGPSKDPGGPFFMNGPLELASPDPFWGPFWGP